MRRLVLFVLAFLALGFLPAVQLASAQGPIRIQCRVDDEVCRKCNGDFSCIVKGLKRTPSPTPPPDPPPIPRPPKSPWYPANPFREGDLEETWRKSGANQELLELQKKALERELKTYPGLGGAGGLGGGRR